MYAIQETACTCMYVANFVIYSINNKMDLVEPKRYQSIVSNASRQDNALRVVITDGSTDIALALIYRIFVDDVFGKDQPVFISLFEFESKAVFLDSVIIELTSCSPNLLHGIIYSSDASVAFKNADVVFCIGSAREYVFFEEEYNSLFFQQHIHIAKFYGESIEAYAKKDARVIVIGTTAAMVISTQAKSIPIKNITTLMMFNIRIAAAHIAASAKCHPTEVKNIIIWGNNNKYSFPDCRYMYFTNGKAIDDKLIIWLRTTLPQIMRNTSNRFAYIRSMAYGLAEHCKILWNGTPENEWTCMGVYSDYYYGTRSGIFFSFPVICKNRQYEIVKGLYNDQYIEKYILDLSRLISQDVSAALRNV